MKERVVDVGRLHPIVLFEPEEEDRRAHAGEGSGLGRRAPWTRQRWRIAPSKGAVPNVATTCRVVKGCVAATCSVVRVVRRVLGVPVRVVGPVLGLHVGPHRLLPLPA